jgi:hypothetical protein
MKGKILAYLFAKVFENEVESDATPVTHVRIKDGDNKHKNSDQLIEEGILQSFEQIGNGSLGNFVSVAALTVLCGITGTTEQAFNERVQTIKSRTTT